MSKVGHFKTELLYNFPWFLRAILVPWTMWMEPGGFCQCHTTFFHTGKKSFNLITNMDRCYIVYQSAKTPKKKMKDLKS
jgi:hypothetical protein